MISYDTDSFPSINEYDGFVDDIPELVERKKKRKKKRKFTAKNKSIEEGFLNFE
jgi:hypothetical protein